MPNNGSGVSTPLLCCGRPREEGVSPAEEGEQDWSVRSIIVGLDQTFLPVIDFSSLPPPGGGINTFWKLPVYSGVKNQHRGHPPPPCPPTSISLTCPPPHPLLSLLGFRTGVKRGLQGDKGDMSGLGGSSGSRSGWLKKKMIVYLNRCVVQN